MELIKHFRSWEKAVAIYPRNHILSSDYGNQGNAFHFHPSYNCEGRPDITKLLNMEYGRVWLQEKEQFDAKITKVVHLDIRGRKFKQKQIEIMQARKENDKAEKKLKALLIQNKRKEEEEAVKKQNEQKRQQVLELKNKIKSNTERIKQDKIKFKIKKIELTKKPAKLVRITQRKKQKTKPKELLNENVNKKEEAKEGEEDKEEICCCLEGDENNEDDCQQECVEENCSGKSESCSEGNDREMPLECKE